MRCVIGLDDMIFHLPTLNFLGIKMVGIPRSSGCAEFSLVPGKTKIHMVGLNFPSLKKFQSVDENACPCSPC